MIEIKPYLFYFIVVRVNVFPEGDELMQKSQFVVKHFYSTISNCKNCNEMLDEHRCLPTNQLEQDHNGTRIVATCKLIKSALRIKRGAKECCREFKLPDFLNEED